MAISANLERLSYDAPDGCIATGIHREVISGVGATRTLLAEESGSLCLFDRAAGNVYTLPTPVEGMQFEFMATVAVTTNNYKLITAAATQFLLGGIIASSATLADSGAFFLANGITRVGILMNGTTSGGLVGSRFKVTAINSTQWAIEGYFVGSGTLIDPFTTS